MIELGASHLPGLRLAALSQGQGVGFHTSLCSYWSMHRGFTPPLALIGLYIRTSHLTLLLLVHTPGSHTLLGLYWSMLKGFKTLVV